MNTIRELSAFRRLLREKLRLLNIEKTTLEAQHTINKALVKNKRRQKPKEQT